MHVPYVKTLLVSKDNNVLDTHSTQALRSPPISLELKDIDCSREQPSDSSIARIIRLLKTGFCPAYSDLRTEAPTVLKYLHKIRPRLPNEKPASKENS